MDGNDAEGNKRLEMLEMVYYIRAMSEWATEMDVKSLGFLLVQFTVFFWAVWFELLGGLRSRFMEYVRNGPAQQEILMRGQA